MSTRTELAQQRILDALADEKDPHLRLSDVFWDAADRNTYGELEDHGYDTDDLATVLLPILTRFTISDDLVAEVIGLLNMLAEEFNSESFDKTPPKWIRDRLTELGGDMTPLDRLRDRLESECPEWPVDDNINHEADAYMAGVNKVLNLLVLEGSLDQWCPAWSRAAVPLYRIKETQ